MQINSISPSVDKMGQSGSLKRSGIGCFADTLFSKTRAHGYNTSSIKTVETDKFSIAGRLGGYLCIYDKERGEAFNWKLNENDVQVDGKTGLKFLINNLGCGLFNMVVVDSELEQGIKEALGVSELEEKPLINFTVRQDQKTGIRYITANGYESSGGQIIMNEEARKKLDSLAKEYLSQYPNLVHSYEEAWFHATFEVRGLTKRTSGGVMQIGPNSISFLNKDGINSWVCIFDPKRWKEVKEKFDRNDNAGEESWEFWMNLFQALKIEAKMMKEDCYEH